MAFKKNFTAEDRAKKEHDYEEKIEVWNCPKSLEAKAVRWGLNDEIIKMLAISEEEYKRLRENEDNNV